MFTFQYLAFTVSVAVYSKISQLDYANYMSRLNREPGRRLAALRNQYAYYKLVWAAFILAACT